MINAASILPERFKVQTAITLLAAVASCGCATKPATLPPAKPAKPNFTIFMVGDSTMADKPVIPANPERGWGQILPMYFQDNVRIENHAVNGRSSKSFIDQDRWATVTNRLRPGDYVIIQFGHNDEKKNDATRYTEPFGSFKANLARFIRDSRVLRATPILATPVARRKFDANGGPVDTHGDYVAAVRQLAQEQQTPLLDLNRDSTELLARLGPESSKRLYDWIPAGEFERDPKGLSDDTHFNAYGASRMCDLAVMEIEANVPALAVWLKQHSAADINQAGAEK
ncbi:MAG: rhamnogalacturonan acetylesterase [Limisphaerales bacterium]